MMKSLGRVAGRNPVTVVAAVAGIIAVIGICIVVVIGQKREAEEALRRRQQEQNEAWAAEANRKAAAEAAPPTAPPPASASTRATPSASGTSKPKAWTAKCAECNRARVSCLLTVEADARAGRFPEAARKFADPLGAMKFGCVSVYMECVADENCPPPN